MTVPDYHVHTILSKHATGTAAEFKQRANAVGMEEICFTDHAPNPHGPAPNVCIDMDQFPRYRSMVGELQDGNGPRVLYGIEADFYPGCEDYLSEWLPKQEFDLVLGSVHFLGDWYFDDPAYEETWETADVAAVWRRYFERVGKLADSGLFDAVAHFDIVKKFGYRPDDEYIVEAAMPALDGVAAAGMAIEINTGGLRKKAAEIYPSAMLLELARKRGIPVFFASDAHRPEEVGSGFDKALASAREAGYSEYVRFRRRHQTATPLPGADL